MGVKLFGTDGVRGVVSETLTNEIAYKIGRAIPHLYDSSVDKIKIAVGKDTRVSSDMLESALIAGLMESGADVTCLGVIPSAAVSYLSKVLKTNVGVMITASHNPYYYNGIKIFNGNGFKLTKMQEAQIEELVQNNKFTTLPNEQLGQKTDCNKATQCYENYLISNASGFFDGLSIVVDCANGAGSKVFTWTLKKLGVRVKTLFTSKNGLKINKDCGATHLEALCNEVKKGGYDIGFALDGDADRLMIVDENGKVVVGESVFYLFSKYLKEKKQLKNNTVVSTVMSNASLEEALKKIGISLIITQVGDENVVEEMLKNNLNFGGETSGHYMFSNAVTTSDGILSAILFLNLLKEYNLPVSKLTNLFSLYPQKVKNIAVEESQNQVVLNSELVQKKIKEWEQKLNKKGRILLRASGTEKVIRLLVEAKDEKIVNEIIINLENEIKKLLN
ncbi:MAG: phosphoglucosamine mutase [Tenericutes bacterium HGW-Tenericutes-4]|nr:MAG: phosphoglucosamine mutase [Tenericutes bacterium HGW-Tenericutes-4]